MEPKTDQIFKVGQPLWDIRNILFRIKLRSSEASKIHSPVFKCGRKCTTRGVAEALAESSDLQDLTSSLERLRDHALTVRGKWVFPVIDGQVRRLELNIALCRPSRGGGDLTNRDLWLQLLERLWFQTFSRNKKYLRFAATALFVFY